MSGGSFARITTAVSLHSDRTAPIASKRGNHHEFVHTPPLPAGDRCRGLDRATRQFAACSDRSPRTGGQGSHHCVQRRVAFVGSDHRAIGGEPDHPVDLQGGIRFLHRPGPGPVLQARTAHEVGLEQGQDQDRDGGAQRCFLARRQSGHAGRRGVVAGARGRPQQRQSDPVRLGQDRQLHDRRPEDHGRREGIRTVAVQVDGVPDRLRVAEEGLHRGRCAGLGEQADRQRPLHGGEVRAQCVHPPQGLPEILGTEARVRDRRVQAGGRCVRARGGDRERLVGPYSGSALRRIRPADARRPA